MTTPRPTPWDIVTLALWVLLFAAGLAPALVFYFLRDWSGVVPQTAFVNTPAILTLGFAGYVGIFAYRTCLDAGSSPADAQSRAIQVVILGLIAFLEVPTRGSAQMEIRTLLELVLRYRDIPDSTSRMLVLFMGWSKLMAWWYLFFLVVRYHLMARRDVFVRMPGLFFAPRPAPDADNAGRKPEGSLEPPAAADEWRDDSRREG